MDEQIEVKLEEEIVRVQKALEKLEPGTDEYSKVEKLLDVYYQMRLEMTKVKLDHEERREKRLYDNGRADEELRLREEEFIEKRNQNRREKIWNWIKIGMDAVKIVGGAVLGIILCYAGFKFEEKGTVTSKFFGRIIDSAFKKITR